MVPDKKSKKLWSGTDFGATRTRPGPPRLGWPRPAPAGRPALAGPARLHEPLYDTHVFWGEIHKKRFILTTFFTEMVPDSGEKGCGVTAAIRLETAAFWKSAPWLETLVAYKKAIFCFAPDRLRQRTVVRKMLFSEIIFLTAVPGVGLVVSPSLYHIRWTAVAPLGDRRVWC